MYEDLLIRANELLNQEYSPKNRNKRVSDIELALKLRIQAMDEVGENEYILSAIASCYAMLDSFCEDGSKYDDAIRVMKRALEIAPDNGHLHACLGEYYHIGKLDFENAAAEYRKAVELSPNEVWVLIGASYLYGDPVSPITIQEAITWLERVVELEPNDPILHAHLATLYFENNQKHQAHEEAVRSLLCGIQLEHGWVERIEAILRGCEQDNRM
jgi:tetratricopeptide (TPR) repeat protein